MLTVLLSELVAWSKVCRENFQVLLMVGMYSMVFGVLVHMGHDKADADSLDFVKQVVTGVGGCLFGILKGRQDRIVPDGASSVTTITQGEK